jgi:hypothetical protein
MLAMLFIVSIMFGIMGLVYTIEDNDKYSNLRAGSMKVLSIYGLSVIGILGFHNPIITVGFILACIAETLLSLLNPIFKKDIFFYVGFLTYIVSYILLGSNIFSGSVIYILMAFIIASITIPLQLKFLDKADIIIKVAMGLHMTALSILLVSATRINIIAIIGVLLIYLCDSIIGHSKFNSKYKLNSKITESLITLPFTFGFTMYVMSRVIK